VNKENKYLGHLKAVKLHPVKKPVAELATIGIRLNAEQLKDLTQMLQDAISKGAQSVVLTGHRSERRLTVLFE
jgi:hypothetical protein